MALVSPGIQISINDQSQYVNANVGSVPLVILATAQDKTYNGVLASGTTAANAGELLAFTSQRDLVTQMGTPTFQLSAAGTPVNGSEINEYGLMTAYSALGLSNQLFAIRADVDLNQLVGTSVRPTDAPDNGTVWLDTTNTQWGITVLDAITNAFSEVTPLIITDSNQVFNDTNFAYDVPTPKNSVGQVGQYALVTVTTSGTAVDNIRLFYKATANSYNLNNYWVQVGSPNWQLSTPAVTGTIANPTIVVNSTLTINGTTVTSSATLTTVAALAASINSASIAGIKAIATSTGYLQLFVTSDAASNGVTADGKMLLTDGTNTPLADVGIQTATQRISANPLNTSGAYFAPYLFYGSYAQSPTGGWYSTDANPRPTGSIWWKTTATGGGLNIVMKRYNSSLASFETLTVPAYSVPASAVYGLDPTGGGVNIPTGQVVAIYGVDDTTYNNLQFVIKNSSAIASATGGTVSLSSGNNGDVIGLAVTAPGSSALNLYSVTMTAATVTAETFVNDILSANIPYVTASVNTNGTITLSHTAGGIIVLVDSTGTAVADAGFSLAAGGSGYFINDRVSPEQVVITTLQPGTDTIEYSASQPYTAPVTGTYWYYSNPADVDVMINDGTAWKGYRNVTSDVRGYNLSNTDPNGPIVTPTTAPLTQSDGTALVAGDLWLDSGDLVNYPALYRYNGTTWAAIDSTDHTSASGIIFADARWDTDGTTDPVAGDFPAIADLLTSNYIDQDAPDYRLYARGTLLFNTRRSGYNVKKFVADYFNDTSFPDLPAVPGAGSTLPTETGAWVTAAGLDSNGVMYAGSKSQRAIVVAAMQSAVDSNLDVLSLNYNFNLIVAPGYPELIPNMLTLNDNRGSTAFIIGDTPLDLAPNTISITNWVNNTGGDGLPSNASSSPYLSLYYPAGQTNDLAGNQVVVPASHAVLRTYLYNDQVAYPWFAPAGVNRGLISNLSDIGYINSSSGQFVHNSVSQGLRDALFTLKINPLTQLPGTGLVVWGQLTRSGSSSARDRVNVVRLENYLRTIFSSVANGYLFEPNDAVTRKSISTQLQGALANVLALRGIYDYLVICDSSNNTSATIANNQLYVDVAIEPMKDVEFIYIPIAIYNPGTIATLNLEST